MKRVLFMASLLSVLSNMFSFGAAAVGYNVAEAYARLRNMVLTTKPESVGLKPAADEIWGVLMETGYSEAVVSLVALADGTVSFYFSNGGGIIGLGTHPGPQRAGKELIALAQTFSSYGLSTQKFPLPKVSSTRFYFLSGSDIKTAEAKEDDLGKGRHPLSPLFYKGHELISEIRAVDEKLRTDQPSG